MWPLSQWTYIWYICHEKRAIRTLSTSHKLKMKFWSSKRALTTTEHIYTIWNQVVWQVDYSQSYKRWQKRQSSKIQRFMNIGIYIWEVWCGRRWAKWNICWNIIYLTHPRHEMISSKAWTHIDMSCHLIELITIRHSEHAWSNISQGPNCQQS